MRGPKRILIVSITIILVASSLSLVNAQPPETNRLTDKLLTLLLKIAYDSPIASLFNPMTVPFKAFRFTEPKFFEAYPNSIDIEYLADAEIVIGSKNRTTGEYKSLTSDYIQHPLFPSEFYTFEVTPPEGTSNEDWTFVFDPPLMIMGEEGDMKTTLRISSNIPLNFTEGRDLVFRVNVSNYKTGGNLFLPPKEGRNPVRNIIWFLGAIGVTMPDNPFGFIYSGKTIRDFSVHVDVLVKMDRFHLAEIIVPQPMEMRPDQLLSIPVEIKNLGSHVDTFNFNVSMNTKYDLKISAPPAVTLQPGEAKQVLLGVASPLAFQDPGTTHSINIEAYSLYQPDNFFTNTVIITTRGVHVSEINLIYFMIFSILMFLGAVAFFIMRRRGTLNRISKKSVGTWKIFEVNNYLKKHQTEKIPIVKKTDFTLRKTHQPSTKLEGKSYKTDEEIRKSNDLQQALRRVRKEQEKQRKTLGAS